MLRVLGYIWAIFGAYWIIFAPALMPTSSKVNSSQRLRLALLAITFALLLWSANVIPAVWLIVLGLGWSAIGLYWVAPKKASQSGERRFHRFLRLLIGAATFSLLFWSSTGVGILGKRFESNNQAVAAAGFAVTLVGLSITAWARIHLGRYWSDRIVIQADHKLVRSGPYARMRHPIYSGVLLGIAGTALVVGEWRGVLALLLMLVNYAIKARREDEILADRFGHEFRDYEKHSGLLLPHF
jgi:protein-S-isoprenylcysteine O-methyltransferase Ste14